tara:strand:+ start:288 stop:641 length:354 start_codon:yes stop_codon:yes gene_type:complete
MRQENIHKTCQQLVEEQFQGRLENLKVTDPEDENYIEGLSFDYVEPNTFTDQLEGYWRWQLSWGGPSDEFNIYINPDKSVHRIEYWYKDWFDGAHVTLSPGTHSDVWHMLADRVASN